MAMSRYRTGYWLIHQVPTYYLPHAFQRKKENGVGEIRFPPFSRFMATRERVEAGKIYALRANAGKGCGYRRIAQGERGRRIIWPGDRRRKDRVFSARERNGMRLLPDSKMERRHFGISLKMGDAFWHKGIKAENISDDFQLIGFINKILIYLILHKNANILSKSSNGCELIKNLQGCLYQSKCPPISNNVMKTMSNVVHYNQRLQVKLLC